MTLLPSTAIPENINVAQLLFKAIGEAEELLELPHGTAVPNGDEWELEVVPFGIVLSSSAIIPGIRVQVWSNADNLPHVVKTRLPWIRESRDLSSLHNGIALIRQLRQLLPTP
jgi:hypothetical protein